MRLSASKTLRHLMLLAIGPVYRRLAFFPLTAELGLLPNMIRAASAVLMVPAVPLGEIDWYIFAPVAFPALVTVEVAALVAFLAARPAPPPGLLAKRPLLSR